ncbi:MAG: sulfur carrier protein ThiS [Phycisphaerales bacterium]|nr:sulfur carrier protein ThiS [Phycisphaerales bacterium]
MNVVVNGQPESLADRSTVADLLRAHGLQSKPCAVEVNREVVPKRRHGEHELRDGDRVEIVTLVGGG